MRCKNNALAFLLAVILSVSCFPRVAALTPAESKLKELQASFKDGEYWNGYNGSFEHTGPKKCPCGGISCSGCSCQCGTFVLNGVAYSKQCLGFVCKLGYEWFGSNPYEDNWSKIYGKTNFQVGDIVRIRRVGSDGRLKNHNHALFIYKIDGDTLYYADCNVTGPCRVNWNGTVTADRLAQQLQLTLANASTTGYVWRCKDSNTGLQAETHAVFTDVKKASWYYSAVDYAYQNKIFSGVAPHTFSPETSVTRAMFVQVLANLNGVDLSHISGEGFEDVKPTAWYAPAVIWAHKNHIVNGMSPTVFAPEMPITREQMCVMLYNYAAFSGNPLKTGSLHFQDEKDISSWAQTAVAACQTAGLIDGVGGGFFAPRETATRAQSAKIFSAYHKKYIA